jgi:hypothetical protein
VARPVQYEQEGHDTNGHALASDFVGSDLRICTYEKGKSESFEKSSNKGKKGKKCSGTNSTARVPCDLCKKHGGAYTTHNTWDCFRFEKDGKEKSNFRASKKGGRKGNPVIQNFAQLTKKIKKLEKVLKKSGKKGRKCHY